MSARTPKAIPAKFPGVCMGCKLSIAQGEMMYWFPMNKHKYHLHCGEKQFLAETQNDKRKDFYGD